MKGRDIMNIQEALLQAHSQAITLIQAGTGQGKTYSIIHTDIFEGKKVLLSVSRTAIRSQTYQNADVNLSKEDNGSNITVINHQEGSFWDDYFHLSSNYDVFVVDEAHALIFDANFTNGYQLLLNTLARLAEDGKKVILLSATMDAMESFIKEQYPLVNVQFFDCGITTKPPGRVSVKVGNNQDFERQVWNLTQKEGRFIVGSKSNQLNYDLHKKYYFINSIVGCSSTAQNVRDSKYGHEIKVQDLYRTEIDELISSGNLPESAKAFFFTSAFREGLNINEDQLIQTAIVNFINPIDNIQAIGRYRGKLKEAIIVLPNQWGLNQILSTEANEVRRGQALKVEYEKLIASNQMEKVASLASRLENSGWFDVPPTLVKELRSGQIDVSTFRCAFRYNRLAAFKWLTNTISSHDNIIKYYEDKLGKSLPSPVVEHHSGEALMETTNLIEPKIGVEMLNGEIKDLICSVDWKEGAHSRQLSYVKRVEFLKEEGYMIQDCGQKRVNGKKGRYSKITKK